MRIIGVDPGLRRTGIALVEARGPGLPKLSTRAMVRAQNLYAMAAAVLAWLEAHRADVVAVEAFSHRGWLGRRVDTAPEMGRLLERVTAGATNLGFQVIEVDPAISKRGFPRNQRALGRLLPRSLRNKHERDAFLVASAAATLQRQEAERGR